MPDARCCWITGWGIHGSSGRWIASACWSPRRSSCRAASGGGCARLDGISRAALLAAASLALGACHRATSSDVLAVTGRCTSHVRSKGPAPQLPGNPQLRSGYGAVIGTLADSGGALPHYTVLAAAPGDSPDSPHASAMADSAGGFVINLLPPGRYRLVVRAYAHRPDSTAVDIVAGEID